jgi:hypothetical protein
MENFTNETSDVFMEVAVKKMELQDKKLADLEERLNNGPDLTKHMQQLIASVEGLKISFNSGQLSNKVLELSARISIAIGLLQKPVENKVNHHHHVPKLIWIAAGLFILLSLVCSGWYMTSEKLNGFVANDTKYRKLKLDSANKRLQVDLDLVDSLDLVNPDLREIVIKAEKENTRNLEMLRRARNMENEASELKRKVLKKN